MTAAPVPTKQLHRFYLDIWALDISEAADVFYDLVRDGSEAVEGFGVGHELRPNPWDPTPTPADVNRELARMVVALEDERDALAKRLRSVEQDFAHYLRDDGGPFTWETHPYEYDDDGAVTGPHPVDDCPPHGYTRP